MSRVPERDFLDAVAEDAGQIKPSPQTRAARREKGLPNTLVDETLSKTGLALLVRNGPNVAENLQRLGVNTCSRVSFDSIGDSPREYGAGFRCKVRTGHASVSFCHQLRSLSRQVKTHSARPAWVVSGRLSMCRTLKP